VNEPSNGMASLSLGAGPPLLLMPGLTPDHRPPTGMARRAQLALMRPLAQERQVWWVNRRQGLPEGTTVADLADDYATMLREWQAAPIDVVGISTGGEVALQLAADHPELVRRLVLVASACRLGPHGHQVERQAAEALERGDRRGAAALLSRMLPSGRFASAVAGGLAWLLPGGVVGRDHHDVLATMRAELAFDLSERLHEITAPTLVVGGSGDANYGEAVFRETATGLPNGHLALHPGRSHAATVTSRGLGPEVNAFLGQPDAWDPR
jgi:pimeloyl-ACP methyl ester carboxylesterase